MHRNSYPDTSYLSSASGIPAQLAERLENLRKVATESPELIARREEFGLGLPGGLEDLINKMIRTMSPNLRNSRPELFGKWGYTNLDLIREHSGVFLELARRYEIASRLRRQQWDCMRDKIAAWAGFEIGRDIYFTIEADDFLLKNGIGTVAELLRRSDQDLKNLGFLESEIGCLQRTMTFYGLRLPYISKVSNPSGTDSKYGLMIDSLAFAPRVLRTLQEAGIETVGDLCGYCESELRLDVRCRGSALAEVKRELEKHNLELRQEDFRA